MSIVLVSTDFSEVSYEAVRHARDIAKADGATLALVHVVPKLAGVADQSMLDWLRDKAPKAAEQEKLVRETLAGKAAELAEGGLLVATHLEEGEPPHAVIVECAERIGANLIVIGSHGRTGIKRMLLGSVAEHVVRYAHCPVLVARSGPQSGPVVTGTDLSEAARPGLAEAARLAASSGSELHVFYVLNAGWFGHSGVGLSPAALAEAMSGSQAFTEANESLQREIDLATKGLSVKTVGKVTIGDAAAILVQHAEDVGARLVVTATHGRTGLRRALIGSVAERIVRLSHTSVLVVRAPQK
ncbi:MAG: universal stress protein [Polyangiaceae bacterium]